MKNKVSTACSLLSVLFLLIVTNKAFTQTCTGAAPTTKDLVAAPTTFSGTPPCPTGTTITSAFNTGTDIYNDGSNDYQVMVWDGTNASFSWDCAGFKSSLLFSSLSATTGSTTLNDPDVVIMKLGATIYSIFVAEVPNGTNAGKIFWACYKWSATTFNFSTSGFLGDVATNGNCSNPNIDVNSCGRVAIAWAQGKVYSLSITTSGIGDYTFGPVAVNVLRSDIYFAQGFIDGKDCTGVNPIAGASVATGDRASYPSGVPRLFEKNTNPDVCISDPSTSCGSGLFMITIAYANQWFDPATFTINSQIIARQFKGTACVDNKLGLFQTYVLNCGYAGRPRIAARPGVGANYEDFQVVMADPSRSCFAGGPPCNPYSTKIYHWGKHNTVAPSPTPDLLNMSTVGFCNLDGVYNNDVAITYRDASQAAGEFVVAWTTNNPGTGTFITNVVSNDVIARTYNMGSTNLTPTGTTQYAIVNGGCNGQTGDQSIASIAGRYSKNVSYVFWDNASTSLKPYIGYKKSTNRPGITPALKQAGNINELRTDVSATDETFTSQPNPFTDDITFKIGLNKGNHASKIEIADINGHVIKTIPVTDNITSVNWKPASSVVAGIYYVKLFTLNKTIVTQVVKSN